MKNFIYVFIVLLLIINCIGCTNREIPKDIRQNLYTDMVKCLELSNKTLKTKNVKYIKEIENLLKKNTSDDFLKDLKIPESKKYTDKETRVIKLVLQEYLDLYNYMNKYNNKEISNIDKLIDNNSDYGKQLSISIQKVVSILEIEGVYSK